MPETPIFWMPSGDDEMRAAAERAQATFRYFWRDQRAQHRALRVVG